MFSIQPNIKFDAKREIQCNNQYHSEEIKYEII